MAVEIYQLWLVQSVVTFMMTGVIWQVQLVTYPLFLSVEKNHFVTYHQSYTPKITMVVLPLMGIELLLALYTFYVGRNLLSFLLLCPVLINWLLTFFVFVPLHGRLGDGDVSHARKLIRFNWARTLLWTARSAFLFSLILLKH